MKVTIIGVDPGLIDTGAVAMTFSRGTCTVEHEVFVAQDRHRIDEWVARFPRAAVFVEAYRPRGNIYGTDAPMRELMTQMRQLLPDAKVVDNTGVKQVVSRELMQLLGVWQFPVTTHHQDLRSAARIGLYGALKDAELNRVLFDHVAAVLPPDVG